MTNRPDNRRMCRDCGRVFPCGKSQRYRRCPVCRKGLQRVVDSTRPLRRICPLCGGPKSHHAMKCEKCYMILCRGGPEAARLLQHEMERPAKTLVARAVRDAEVAMDRVAEPAVDDSVGDDLAWLRERLNKR